MRIDIIFCEKCQVFKPLEMYKHLLHEPENVTKEEIESLN